RDLRGDAVGKPRPPVPGVQAGDPRVGGLGDPAPEPSERRSDAEPRGHSPDAPARRVRPPPRAPRPRSLGDRPRPLHQPCRTRYHLAAMAINVRGVAPRGPKAHLEAHGITPLRLADHRVSKSIYLTDPDGHGLELFVDTDPAIWRENPAAVATVAPLEL